MKIYKNKNLTDEVTELDLGILEAGQTQKYTYYVYNEDKSILKNLKFDIEHVEVSIIKSPQILKYGDISELVVEWKANISVKKGVKAKLTISGIELWE